MRAFISYSHRDADLLSQLHEHLSVLQREGLLETWTDREILPGSIIDDDVDVAIADAPLFLLLVSASFIASNYCYEREFARALERQQTGAAKIVPIIVRECDWDIQPLRQFKALPYDGRAVVSRHWHTPDEGFRSVVEGLRPLLQNPQDVPSRGARPTSRPKSKEKFVPDERHVTEEQRAVLKKACEEIVDRLTARYAKGPEEVAKRAKGRSFGIVWTQFNEEFGTTEHGLSSLPRELFDHAKQWLLRYRASKDKNYKRTDPQKYHDTLTTTIYTLSGVLGWSKPELYAFASRKVGYERPIESLNDLGNSQLETVKQRIRYEHTKRKAKSGQSRARRTTAAASAASGDSILCSPLIGFERDPASTSDRHKYWLTATFTNASPTKQAGYRLELLFPDAVPTTCDPAVYQVAPTPVALAGALYRSIVVQSSDGVFRGQEVQLVDRIRRPLSYEMDHRLYAASHSSNWGLVWSLHVGNLPALRGAVPWSSMHTF